MVSLQKQISPHLKIINIFIFCESPSLYSLSFYNSKQFIIRKKSEKLFWTLFFCFDQQVTIIVTVIQIIASSSGRHVNHTFIDIEKNNLSHSLKFYLIFKLFLIIFKISGDQWVLFLVCVSVGPYCKQLLKTIPYFKVRLCYEI